MSDGFMKKVFNLICSNIENGNDNDLMSFGDKLSSDEMGRLSGIIARGRTSRNSKNEFVDCLNIISEEYNKKAENQFLK